MKSINFVAGLVAGIAVLGTVSAHAAAQAVPLNLSITTYSQTTTTNEAGVITYISTTHTFKSADLLSKITSSLGVTVPAGSQLGVSVFRNSTDDVYPGDVVIMGPNGVILYDLDDRYSTETGSAYMYVGFSDEVTQTATSAYNSRVPQRASALSTSTTQKGLGYLFFDIYANPTEAVDARVGCVGDFDHDVGGVQYVMGNFGSNLTTGSVNFAGGGEFENYGLDFDSIQPASVSLNAAAANVPWSLFPFN